MPFRSGQAEIVSPGADPSGTVGRIDNCIAVGWLRSPAHFLSYPHPRSSSHFHADARAGTSFQTVGTSPCSYTRAAHADARAAHP